MILLAMIRMDDVNERQFAEKFFSEHSGQTVGLKQFRVAFEEEFKRKPIFRVEPIERWNEENLWATHIPLIVSKGAVSRYDE